MIAQKLQNAWSRRTAISAMLRFGCSSFGHFGEDRIYDRLLKPGRGGTYIDVGANHPVLGSNTFALYANGWSGLTVEPNPKYAPLFRKHRPRDIHLTEGAARERGSLTYHKFWLDGLNTFDPTSAATTQSEGYPLLATAEIPCRPLRDMVAEHLQGRPIDLLSVDCEGLDLDVLESLDIQHNRPATVFVEDFERYWTFQEGGQCSGLERFLRGQGYVPIAQTVWTVLYVAKDWRELFQRSPGLDVDRAAAGGYMPRAAHQPRARAVV